MTVPPGSSRVRREVQTLRPAAFFELSGEYVSRERHEGQRSWYVRGQNFVVVVSWAAEGEVLREPAAPDEHAILVPEGGAIEVEHGGGRPAEAVGPAFVIAPPGEAGVTVRRAGFVVRVFTARSEVTAKAINDATYTIADVAVAPLPESSTPVRPGRLRVIPLAGVHETPGRRGRLCRTDSLTINWCAPVDGPQDVDDLSVRVDDDVEQAVLTLDGDYVHHVRRPWTDRLRDWRPDEHVQVSSPSVTLIEPGDVHATRAVGPGRHQLIEVSAPVRTLDGDPR